MGWVFIITPIKFPFFRQFVALLNTTRRLLTSRKGHFIGAEAEKRSDIQSIPIFYAKQHIV